MKNAAVPTWFRYLILISALGLNFSAWYQASQKDWRTAAVAAETFISSLPFLIFFIVTGSRLWRSETRSFVLKKKFSMYLGLTLLAAHAGAVYNLLQTTEPVKFAVGMIAAVIIESALCLTLLFTLGLKKDNSPQS